MRQYNFWFVGCLFVCSFGTGGWAERTEVKGEDVFLGYCGLFWLKMMPPSTRGGERESFECGSTFFLLITYH